MKPALPGPFWRGLGWVALFYALAAALTVAIVVGIGAGVVR
jgi:hypothetical protein